MLFEFAYLLWRLNSETLKKKKNKEPARHWQTQTLLCTDSKVRQTDRWTDGHLYPVNLSTSLPWHHPFQFRHYKARPGCISLCLFVCMCSPTVKSSASQRSAEGQCVCQANRWPAAVRNTLSYVAGGQPSGGQRPQPPRWEVVAKEGSVCVCLRWVAEDICEKWGSIFY